MNNRQRVLVSEFQKLSSCCARDEKLAHLISRIVIRDEDALGSRYEQTGSRLFGLVLRMLNNPKMANEFALDVSMQVWRRAG